MADEKRDAAGVPAAAQAVANGPGPAADRSLAENGAANPLETSTASALSGELDPVLAELVDEYTRRTFAGERVDIEELCARDPSRAEELRGLLRSVGGLATLGREIEQDVGSTGTGEGEGGLLRVFGDYRLIREIGRGGMGIVYEAQQVSLERRVALKVLSLAAAVDDRARKRFQVEAHVAGLLEHPRVVPVYAVGIHEGVPFYAMKFIEGGSLADVIAELRRFDLPPTDRGRGAPLSEAPSLLAQSVLSGRFAVRPDPDSGERLDAPAPVIDTTGPGLPQLIRGRAYIRTIVRLGVQAAEALAYAHEQGIIHRDIKPANLLLDRRGDVWVADFGMADVQGDAGVTQTGDLPGTLRYMSPEQALGKRALVDRRTDIYSLGATLYELLALKPPVNGSDKQEILVRIAEAEPEPLKRLNPAVPVDLATIVTKALSKEPSNRYETAWHLADDLGRFLDGKPIAARRVGPLGRSWRWCRRKPVVAGLIAGLALAIVVGFAGITWNWREAVRRGRLLTVAEKSARAEATNARTAEQEALLQSEKADAINRFLTEKLIGQAEPDTNPDALQVTLLQALDRAAAEVGNSFAGRPDIEAGVRFAVGRAYHYLGQYRASEAHLRAAHERLELEPGAADADRLAVMADLGHILIHQNRLADAEPLLTRAFHESQRLLGPGHEISLRALEYFANLEHSKGRMAEAEVLLRRLVDVRRRFSGARDPRTRIAMNNLGALLGRMKKYAEAERIYRDIMEYHRETKGAENVGTLRTYSNLGDVLERLGRLEEAEKLLRQSVDGQRRLLGPDHPTTLRAVSKMAELYAKIGRREEAERLLRECLEAQRRVQGPDHPDTAATAKRLESVVKDRAKQTVAKAVAGPAQP